MLGDFGARGDLCLGTGSPSWTRDPPPSPLPPPQGLLACTQLRCLNLAATGLLHWSIPPPSPFPLQGLLACTQLRCLNLAATGLLHWSIPPPSPFPLQGLLACTQLRCLNLAVTGLLHWPMPPVPGAMPALQELVLQRNAGIREVPMGAFICCPALLRLDLSGEVG